MDKPKPSKKSFKVSNQNRNIDSSHKWTVTILILSFVLSIIFSGVTTSMLSQLNLLWAFFVLLFIIFTNIIFDLVATATQTAEEQPFHSLSARKVSGASESVNIIRHAPQVANFCADVIGDIAGIISGGATAIISTELIMAFNLNGILPSLILTGLVSALTIGGKAFFKVIAMKQSNNIVFFMGKVVYFICCPFKKKKKGRK